MSWNSFKSIALAFLCVSTLSVGNAYADVPLPLEVHTVAAAGTVVANTNVIAVPAEHTFTVTQAGTYQLTLTDFGSTSTPAVPMAALKLAITSGGTIVGTPLLAAGTMTFSATPGDYVVHVVGTLVVATLGSQGSGQIGIHINDSTNTATYDFNDALAPPPVAIPNGGSGIDDRFTVPTSGNYQITLNDLQLPQALNTLSLAVTQLGGSLVTTLTTAGSTTVALQSGVTYGIFAVGSATAPALNAGLFGASVTLVGATTPVYAKTVPVGSVTLLGSPTLAAGSYSLTASDLQLPSALTQFGVAVALNGQAVTALHATGTQPFTAVAATYQVFAVGVAPAGGMGSYSAGVQSPQGTALSVARAVIDTASTGRAYSFDATAASGQTYAFDLADFGYPAQFLSLKAAVVQAGTLVTGSQLTIGTSGTPPSATGTVNITPAAGPLSILVFAQPAAATSTTAAAGLFGTDLTVSGAAPVFETTQGVGQLFSVRKVSILTAGSYAVTVGDVGFPAAFQNLAAIVTRGTSRAGSIYGGGTFGFPAVVGDYYVNFVAQPGGTDQAGTYSMLVETAPAPTLTFTSDVSSVTSGGTVTLKWTGGNVTSCTASNGWSGSEPASGQFTSGALTATTTFALSCDGPGGTASNSVTVTVTDPPPPAKSGGGGGAIRPELLVFLLGVILLRRRIFPC